MKFSTKIAAVASGFCLLGAGLMPAVPAAAVQGTDSASGPAATLFLDKLVGVDTSEIGSDEVYLRYQGGDKIWPISTAYISIGGDGDSRDINHRVTVGGTIELWDVDDVGGDDLLGRATISSTGVKILQGSGAVYNLHVQ